jgi:hypothetical protein
VVFHSHGGNIVDDAQTRVHMRHGRQRRRCRNFAAATTATTAPTAATTTAPTTATAPSTTTAASAAGSGVGERGVFGGALLLRARAEQPREERESRVQNGVFDDDDKQSALRLGER